MKQFCVLFLFGVLLARFTWGQSIEFLPPGVFSLSVKTEVSNFHSVVNLQESDPTPQNVSVRQNVIGLLEDRLEKAGLEPTDFTGEIEEIRTQVSYNLFLGLSESFTLGLIFPRVTHERISKITMHGATSDIKTNFDQYNSSAKSEGNGDYEAWLFWRLAYTDEIDFQLALGTRWDNGAFNYDHSNAMPLGSGTRDAAFLLRWVYYSRFSTFKSTFDLRYIRPFDGKTKNRQEEINLGKDEEVTIKRGVETKIRYRMEWHRKVWNVGGDFFWELVDATSVDGTFQHDGRITVSTGVFVGIGNLYRLEEGPVALPWHLQLEFHKVATGFNAPVEETWLLSGSIFF